MNTNAKVRAVYNRRHDEKLEIEIYLSRNERKFIATGISVPACDWDNVHKVATGFNGPTVNAEIGRSIQRIWSVIANLNPVTISGITAALRKDKEKSSTSFLTWMDEQIQKLEVRESTRRRKLVTFDALARYGRIRRFEDLTPASLQQFDEWLRHDDPALKKTPGKKTIHRSQATIHNYHKDLKVFAALAYRLGLIDHNPYDHFVDNRGKSGEITPLTREEVEAIEVLDLDGNISLQKARDFFIFQCYTGMAYSDALGFDPKTITRSADGKAFILADRKKTGQCFYTPLLPQAEAVLNRNSGKVPFIDNSSLNIRLKIIAAKAGIDKKLTSHVARHTFITLSLEAGAAPNVVQKMVGHSSVVMTERYTHLSLGYIERGADLLFKKATS